jgi:hypothetical protein
VYPRLTNLTVSHLVCPNPVPELPLTTPNFAAPGANTTPDTFINQVPLNLKVLRMYARSGSPAQTRSLAARCLRIGNATDLTAFMIGVAADSGASSGDLEMAHANWNLDSDRGYGYKTWAGSLPFTGPPVVDEYVGARTTPGVDQKCPDV